LKREKSLHTLPQSLGRTVTTPLYENWMSCSILNLVYPLVTEATERDTIKILRSLRRHYAVNSLTYLAVSMSALYHYPLSLIVSF